MGVANTLEHVKYVNAWKLVTHGKADHNTL